MTEDLKKTFKNLRQDCHHKARDTLGTKYIFEKKSIALSKRLKTISIVGAVGGFTVAILTSLPIFSSEPIISIISTVGAIVALIQGIAYIWILHDEPTSTLMMWSTIKNQNSFLHEDYSNLGKNPPPNFDDFKSQKTRLDGLHRGINTIENQYPLTSSEEREALRHALYILKQPCPICKIVPKSMKSSECDTCGNF